MTLYKRKLPSADFVRMANFPICPEVDPGKEGRILNRSPCPTRRAHGICFSQRCKKLRGAENVLQEFRLKARLFNGN